MASFSTPAVLYKQGLYPGMREEKKYTLPQPGLQRDLRNYLHQSTCPVSNVGQFGITNASWVSSHILLESISVTDSFHALCPAPIQSLTPVILIMTLWWVYVIIPILQMGEPRDTKCEWSGRVLVASGSNPGHLAQMVVCPTSGTTASSKEF